MRALLLRQSQSLHCLSFGLRPRLSACRRKSRQWLRYASSAPTATAVLERTKQPVVDDRRLDEVSAITRLEPTSQIPSSRVHLPPASARNNVEAWLSAVEPYLPLRLKTAHPRWPLHVNHENVLLQDLPEVILRARREANFDIPIIMAMSQNRWDAMLWIYDVVLQLSKSESVYPDDKAIFRSIRYPLNEYLDDWSQRSPENVNSVPLSGTTSRSISLDCFTLRPHSTAHVASWTTTQRHVGLLWMSAARLLASATTTNDKRSHNRVRHALRLVGLLHFHGYIPPKVYNDASMVGSLGIRQPAMMGDISDSIMSALFDAAVQSDEDAQVSGLARLDLSPEIWIEFVLWCCVRGGWLLEAASILKMLRPEKKSELRKNEQPWRLFSFEAANPLSLDAAEKKPKWAVQRKLEPPAFPSRSSSAEVVVALVDAMFNSIHTLPLHAERMETTLESLHDLRQWLSLAKVTFGVSQDEFLARLADQPDHVFESHPRIMERILTSIQPLRSLQVPAVDSELTLGTSTHDVNPPLIQGLYHRLLDVYLRRDDVQSIVRVLKDLLKFVDNSFTSTVQSRKSRSNQAFVKGSRVELGPLVPPGLLADMFDMFLREQALDVCRWLLRSTETERSVVPPELYANQGLLPALCRFAVAAEDDELFALLSKITTREAQISLFIAVAESRLSNRNWSLARIALNKLPTLAQDMQAGRKGEQFNFLHITALIRALLPSVADTTNREDSLMASDILRELLRGDYGPLWGGNESCRGTIMLLLSSADPLLQVLCSDLVDPSGVPSIALPRRPFEAILEGLVIAYGSAVGRQLWETWCSSSREAFLIPWPNKAGGALSRQQVLHFSASSPSDAELHAVRVPGGAIEPSISTLRIIITQALWEDHLAENNQEDEVSSSVLPWARDILQRRFKLSSVDARYMTKSAALDSNLMGKLQQPYGLGTLEVWAELRPEFEKWLSDTEGRLRTFAVAEDQDEVSIEAPSDAQRTFVHELAIDLGLLSRSGGADLLDLVLVLKDAAKTIPQQTLFDVHDQMSSAQADHST